MSEIKRMNGQKQQLKKEPSPTGTAEKENSVLKSEVSSLKQRIEAMTKNIDELTCMVQKVTLATQVKEDENLNSNNKRTKVDSSTPAPLPDSAMSAAPVVAPSPQVSPNGNSNALPMELDDTFALPPSIPSPMPVVDRTTSSSELSDEGFVDQLFTAFKTEDFDFDESETIPKSSDEKETNRPRPELMNKLSDALSVLPRDIQELIVDRLVQAITSPKEIQENISAANALTQVDKKDEASAVPATTTTTMAPTKDPKQIANLQLAAATLAALLSQCGGELKQPKDSHNKTLLIPVHA